MKYTKKQAKKDNPNGYDYCPNCRGYNYQRVGTDKCGYCKKDVHKSYAESVRKL